jgi:hypothetical protein
MVKPDFEDALPGLTGFGLSAAVTASPLAPKEPIKHGFQTIGFLFGPGRTHGDQPNDIQHVSFNTGENF